MTTATDAKLAAGLRLLAEQQRLGIAPPAGEVSRAEIARLAGVSEKTIQRIEGIFVARLSHALLQDPATPRRIRKAASISLARLLST